MMIALMHDATTWLTGLTHWTDALQMIHWHLPLDLAQQFKDPDFAGDIQKAFNNFVKTGQVWAFLIGIILGYLIKGFTSFG
jgi:hypothetical protein